jgi:hypothetical protein
MSTMDVKLKGVRINIGLVRLLPGGQLNPYNARLIAVRGKTLPAEVSVFSSTPVGQCIDVDDVALFRETEDGGGLPPSCLCP